MSKSQNGLSVITEGVEMNDVTTSKAWKYHGVANMMAM